MSPKTQLFGIRDQNATGHFGHRHAGQHFNPLQVQKIFVVLFQKAWVLIGNSSLNVMAHGDAREGK